MKRFIALLSLIAYTTLATAIFSPIALAEETADSETASESSSSSSGSYIMCNFSNNEYRQEFSSEEDYEDFASTKDNKGVEFEKALGESYKDKKCGEPNSLTGYLEKGDCTANGEIVTEITEVIGGEVESGDNRIIDVYKGSCCLYAVSGGECKDTRYIYTEEYGTCIDNATNCEKRQWIISTSGTGIIKVYVKQLYRWAAATVGFIAVVTIVVSGIQISISGVSGDITSAKNRILQSIAGIVLLFLSGIILYTINPDFFS